MAGSRYDIFGFARFYDKLKYSYKVIEKTKMTCPVTNNEMNQKEKYKLNQK